MFKPCIVKLITTILYLPDNNYDFTKNGKSEKYLIKKQ